MERAIGVGRADLARVGDRAVDRERPVVSPQIRCPDKGDVRVDRAEAMQSLTGIGSE